MFQTLLGAILGLLTSIFILYIQNIRDMSLKKAIYLTNLLYEFEYNIKILRRMKNYIMPGPDIDHLWSPVEINANFLVTEAWNALVLGGVLKSLKCNIETLQIANRTVLDAKRTINEITVNWYRTNEWHEYDKAMGNQLLNSRQLYKETAINDAKKVVNYAIENLEESTKLLNSMLNEKKKRRK